MILRSQGTPPKKVVTKIQGVVNERRNVLQIAIDHDFGDKRNIMWK